MLRQYRRGRCEDDIGGNGLTVVEVIDGRGSVATECFRDVGMHGSPFSSN